MAQMLYFIQDQHPRFMSGEEPPNDTGAVYSSSAKNHRCV
jgi:hypothetical protein